MATYFTADTHFSHARVLEFCHRPFDGLDDMHEALIERWNSRVQPGDDIFVLGDFAHKNKRGDIRPIFDRLRGTKHLLIGNHDDEEVQALPWASVADLREIKITTMGGITKQVVLCHYPMRSWNGMYRGSLHLYGHEHGNIQDYDNACDVGVDRWNWTPVSIEEAWGRMMRSTRNPIGPAPKPLAGLIG